MNVACMPSDVFSSLFYQYGNKTAFDYGRQFGEEALVDELQVGKKNVPSAVNTSFVRLSFSTPPPLPLPHPLSQEDMTLRINYCNYPDLFYFHVSKFIFQFFNPPC
jgi:hypothetical protein